MNYWLNHTSYYSIPGNNFEILLKGCEGKYIKFDCFDKTRDEYRIGYYECLDKPKNKNFKTSHCIFFSNIEELILYLKNLENYIIFEKFKKISNNLFFITIKKGLFLNNKE